MAKKDKPSKVEVAKQNSNNLRGTIAQTLASDAVSFGHDDAQLLKFHGTYQQDNRDERGGGKKSYSFMIRTKTPGGRLTADQYMALDDLATQYTSNNSLRLTTRQAFQFHGIIKSELKQTIAAINGALVSTLAACGDVERNVMASPAPLPSVGHRIARDLAKQIATKLAPATGAYHEIWIDGEKVSRQEVAVETEEPFYGPTYLPRKFKTAIALPEDNSVDIYTQDCGLIPVIVDGSVKAINILVGGGLGMTHRKADTFARLGTQLGSVQLEYAVEAVKIICSIFRDHGNRSDRRHARLKYLIEEWGMERFTKEFKERATFELNDWIDVGPMKFNDYLGKHDQGNGRYFYGVWVSNGRVSDGETAKVKSAFRAVAQTLRPTVILTPNQSVIFADLSAEQVDELEAILTSHGVNVTDELKPVRRYSMACVSLPTCGLALAEAERYIPTLVDEIEQALTPLGLEDEEMTVRMTGCPNGCARPYTADLAFVGRKPQVYDIYVGGRLAGDRLAEIFKELVPADQIIKTLTPLFEAWSKDRKADESLGDFYNRVYADDQPRTILTGAKEVRESEALDCIL